MINNEYDNLIVETDKIFEYVLQRNVGFVQILYSAETLLSMGITTYNCHRTGQIDPAANNNLYLTQAYPGANEDLELLFDLLDQVRIRVQQNVDAAVARYGQGRPVVNVLFHDFTLLVVLG